MKKTVVMSIMLLVLLACLSGCTKTAPQKTENTPIQSTSPSAAETLATTGQVSDNAASKITSLQNEMSKYNTNLLPNQKMDICTYCINYLKEILLDKMSITMPEDMIIGDNENFYLKFSKETKINDITFRLIEFGLKSNNDMGTEKVLLLQNWERNNEIVDVQHIYTAAVAENITILLEYELIQTNGNYYINIIDKEYTPETIVMDLTTFKYDNQKWVRYIDACGFADDTWKLETNEEYIQISCSKIDSCDKYEYEYQYINNRLKITALNDPKESIGYLDLFFDNGKWIVEKAGTPTPSAGDPSQNSSSKWHYDLKKDGLYRTDLNTGDAIKINDQDYASGIVITDDWLYFSVDKCLYRMDNANRRELISDEGCYYLSLSGGWFYYVNSSGINRMKLDGSGREQILQCECNGMALTDKYIFYAQNVPEADELDSEPGGDDGPQYMGELHRVSLDGKGDVKVTDMITDFSVYANTVYYADGEDYRLYALNPETVEKEIIYDGNFVEQLYFGGGYAFFILDRNLVKMSLTDGKLTQLTNAYWNRCLGILDGYVYGATDDPDAQYNFYRIKIDGIALEKVE